MTGLQLLEASRLGDAATVRTLLSTPDAQSFINYQDGFRVSSLHLAAGLDNPAITEQLIAARCNVDLQTKDGLTPLHIAAQKGCEAITEQLIAACCKLDLQMKNGWTPLFLAVEKGHAFVTKHLIAAQCKVHFQDKSGFTLLHIAAGKGHAVVTEQLLEARCNIDHQMEDGRTPLHMAADEGRAFVTKHLIAAQCGVDIQMDDGSTPLHMAAYKGHASVTKELIDSSRCNLDSQTISGCTPLLIATQEKLSSITEQLITSRCNVDLANKEGFTPLHMAVYNGLPVISKQLLDARCNVDLQTKDGCTPLHLAAHYGHAILAKQLLAARCNVDLQNKKGERAVVLARVTGHAPIAKLILSHKQKDAAGAIKDIIPQAQAARGLAHPATCECAVCVYTEESADLRARGIDSMGFFRGKDGSVRSITEELSRWRLEEEQKASVISQKKEQANTRNTRNDRRLDDAADAQAVSKEEDHSEEVKKKKKEQQEEETDFDRVWREPMELLQKVKGKQPALACGAVPKRRPLPWMQAIREMKYDFSKMEEEDEYEGLFGGQAPLMPPVQTPKKTLNAGASEFVPNFGGIAEILPQFLDGSGTGTREGHDDPEVPESLLPGDMSEEQWMRANSENGCDHLTLWYTDQVRKWYRHADARMAQSFCQRVRLLSTGQWTREWSYVLKKPLKGCKAPINETYLDQNRTALRILWTEVLEGTSSKILLWYVSSHKKVGHYIRQIDDSLARLNRRTPADRLSGHAPCTDDWIAGQAQQDDEQASGRMMIERDQVFLDPLANSPLKIWEVGSRNVERLQEEGWEPKLRLTSTEEQVIESMETVLLLGRSGTGKTICIANKMQADRCVAPGMSQLFVARSSRICSSVASLQGSSSSSVGVHAQDSSGSSNMHFLTLHEVIHNAGRALGFADKKPWDQKDLRVDYLKFKRDVFPAVLAARRRTATCTVDALVVWTVMRSFIKGSYEAVLGIDATGARRPERAGIPVDDVETLLSLGEERLRLSPEQRREAFELCLKCRAEYGCKGLWDNGDLVLAIHSALVLASEEQRHEFGTRCKFDKVYVDEVQDLTSAELALLVKMSASGILFLAGDPAQSVEEGVAFRFEDVRSVFYELTGRAPTKPLTLTLNFRSHTGILDAAGVLLEWLFDYFPGSCKKLPQDDGLCRGPRPGWAMPVSHRDLARQGSSTGLVILTPDENVPKLKEDLLQCAGGDAKDMSQVLGIREAKGLDFSEVVIVDFFKCLDERQQVSWKQFLQAAPSDGICDEHPEVETHLKLLYTAVTRAQRRLNFVETAPSKSASVFFRRLEEKGKLVKLVLSDTSELSLATGMMSPDEWIHRGLEFACKAWECRGEARGGGGAGGEMHDIAVELRWWDLATDCFGKAGSSGDEYMSKAKLERAYSCFLNDLQIQQKPAASIEQSERNGIKLVAACMKEGMWLQAHYLASLLPLKSVTNLDYRMHLRSQWILTPLEVGVTL